MKGLFRSRLIIGAVILAAGSAAAVTMPMLNATPTAAIATAAPATSPSPTTHAKHAKLGQVARALLVKLVAHDTGKSVAEIRSELKAGKSLNDIAGTQAASVRTQALARVKKTLDRAVLKGKLTVQQEATLMTKAGKQLDKLMSRQATQ